MVAAVAAGRGWPYFDPEYETLNARINPPKVVIDNKACETATIIKLDSLNRHGILLEVVQVLADLELSIRKAYISSDGGWFMDVFHVTDQQGNKLTDEVILGHIEQSLGEKGSLANALLPSAGYGRHIGVQSLGDYTVLELKGTDRPGLLADVSQALAELGCNVAAAEVWTHRMRVACMLYVTDAEDPAGGPLPPDGDRLRMVQRRLLELMAGDQQYHQQEVDAATTGTRAGDFTAAMAGQITHTERRLHQMMQADGDYEYEEEEEQPAAPCSSSPPSMSLPIAFSSNTAATTAAACKHPTVTVRNCVEKGYSVVNVQCLDRPKLLFDTVCTLTDMQYVVFHATIDCDGPFAYQEYYIRHVDGSTLKVEAERQRVVRCLEAAISRRAPQGVRLELCTKDRLGLLSEVTRIFSENKLSVSRAEVSTRDDMAANVFYVTDSEGGNVDPRVLEAVRERIGHAVLQVKEEPVVNTAQQRQAAEDDGTATRLATSLGSFFRSHSERLLYSLGLIKSCS